MVLPLSLVCLLVVAGASTAEHKLHPDASRRPWGVANKTLEARSYRPADHHQQKWREANTLLAKPPQRTDAKATYHFRSSPKVAGVVAGKPPHAATTTAPPTTGRGTTPANNSLREMMRADSAGEGKDSAKKKRKEGDDEDEDKKTLSQQIADGKYGLIQKEIYPKPPLRPGIISYKNNPEVPSDTIKNLGGLEAEEIWLAEDHVLVLRGGWFPNHMNRTEVGSVWPPIDSYQAPPRQVKIPARPKVPPPFPVQLKDGGPTHFIGPNGTKSFHPFPPPFFPFPPGDGFYPPPGNESLYPPPPYPYPPPSNESYPQGNYPPPQGNYPYPPENGQFPYPPPPHGYMPFPNGTSPFGPLPPFFPPLPPGAAFLPPPGNQTEYDEDDPSIYYPPPYDFYYPQDNTTKVPPGPLVPGIILPPPPHFFAPLNDDKPRAVKRPTSSPLPHVPLGVYPQTTSPKPKHITQYYPTPSPRPIVVQQQTPRPLPPATTPRPIYYPMPRDPQTTPFTPHHELATSPPTSTPYGSFLPGPRPTVKRPYLTYVPVTTALRKKKPRPTTTPNYEFEITQLPVVLQATITEAKPPKPPKFVSPQHVQVFHKGESPIIARPFYYNDNVVTSTPESNYDLEENVITSTPRPNYITEGLSKLKDILYTSPAPTQLYPTDDRRKHKGNLVTTVETVKSIELTTETPLKYYTDFTRTPIYVKDLDNINAYNKDPSTTAKQQDIDNNSVHPTAQPYRDAKGGRVTTTQAPLLGSYQPNRAPKTTFYFYDEPHYEQGYVQEVPAKQNAYTPPKWQYDNNRPSQRPSYNILGNVKTEEERLLAEIAETLRQPGNNFYYNNPAKQSTPNNYYTSNVRQPAYPISRPLNGYSNSSPLSGYSNSSPRPGFYITRKPEYYHITTPSSFNNNGQRDREFPYNFEDVIQSTERPPPQLYVSTQRPHYQSTRLKGPDITVQTSPKTVYEYSFQKQPDTATNYVSTERPKHKRFPVVRQPTTAQYYGEYSQSVTPDTNNQIYQTTTSSPVRKYPVIQPATPDPLDHYFTHQDDTVLDDITKKYFTIFGQKLRPGDNNGGFVPMTTPLPAVVRGDKPARYPSAQQPGSQGNNYPAAQSILDKPTQIPLYDDIAVNYRSPRPPIHPDSEFINPHRHQYRGEDDSETEGGKLISYKLPGNEGGHFYFVTPQVVKPQQQQQQQQRRDNGAYQYPVPARGLRTRRNKSKDR